MYKSPPTKAGTRAMMKIGHVCDKWGDTNIPSLIREVEEEAYLEAAAQARAEALDVEVMRRALHAFMSASWWDTSETAAEDIVNAYRAILAGETE